MTAVGADASVALLTSRREHRSPRRLARRLGFTLLVLASVAAVSLLMADMLRLNGMDGLQATLLGLTTLLLLPIAISFWMAMAGLLVTIRGGDALGLRLPSDAASRDLPEGCTALVMPIYNEEPDRLLAGLAATWSSLRGTGQSQAFDLFVLSDTSDARRWVQEELAVTRFAAGLPGAPRVHYRNRASNQGKKAGNIADFCERWGGEYRYMVVLDADSVMSGATLVHLVRLMEAHPRAGIVQVPPAPVNRRTLFGRLQQFAAGVYGPAWSAGLAWLQGGEGNYYGHNAIVRIAPFVEHCRLPVLSGRPPLGGMILSHDFVEAALMRRAGYGVHLVPDIDGSYEEPPANVVDYEARDRRWCQGNLQHARLLALPGLHPMSRVHLAIGVMSYLGGPLWVLLLALSTAEALRRQLSDHAYFAPGGSLFPVWEVSVQARAALLFALVMALLFLPRVLILLTKLSDARERRRHGGGVALTLSVAGEALFSMLIAPVLALAQTRFVFDILRGRSSGWTSPPRDDRGLRASEALRRHAGTTLLGLLWSALLASLAPEVFWWMLPVLAGLVLSVPLTIVSSRVQAGRWARRRGLFLTPEEIDPPPVLRELRERLASPPKCQGPAADEGALDFVLRDGEARAAHLALAEPAAPPDPLQAHRVQGLVLKARLQGPATLSDEEQRELLLDASALRDLARLSPLAG